MSHRNIKEWWTSEPRAHWDVGFQWNSWNNRVSTIDIPYLLQQKLPLSQPPAVQLSLTQWTSRCRSWVVGMGAVNPKPSSIDVRAWGLQPSTGDNHPARAWISSGTWRWLCLYLRVFAISVQSRTDVRSTSFCSWKHRSESSIYLFGRICLFPSNTCGIRAWSGLKSDPIKSKVGGH